jgi:fructose-bisphosphate aldolase class II
LNVIMLEHAEAIVAGAAAADTPVILQISQNAVRYRGGQLEPIAAACRAVAAAAEIPVGLHLDHVDDEDLFHAAPDAGFGSVRFDASRRDYDANVAATREAADWAHEHGIWLEAELGEIGGKEGQEDSVERTDPEEAAAFVAATGVDGLAVTVGTQHWMRTQTADLDFALIEQLRRTVPVPLVLHGSSGVADDDVRRAIAAGLTKINVATALNVEFTRAVRDTLGAEPDMVDPRKYLDPARDAVAAASERLLRTIAGAAAGEDR